MTDREAQERDERNAAEAALKLVGLVRYRATLQRELDDVDVRLKLLRGELETAIRGEEHRS